MRARAAHRVVRGLRDPPRVPVERVPAAPARPVRPESEELLESPSPEELPESDDELEPSSPDELLESEDELLESAEELESSLDELESADELEPPSPEELLESDDELEPPSPDELLESEDELLESADEELDAAGPRSISQTPRPCVAARNLRDDVRTARSVTADSGSPCEKGSQVHAPPLFTPFHTPTSVPRKTVFVSPESSTMACAGASRVAAARPALCHFVPS